MSENDFYLYIDSKPVKVSEEVYREFMRYERKERYFMEDLKTERMVIDQEAQTVKVIPSREESMSGFWKQAGNLRLPGRMWRNRPSVMSCWNGRFKPLPPRNVS